MWNKWKFSALFTFRMNNIWRLYSKIKQKLCVFLKLIFRYQFLNIFVFHLWRNSVLLIIIYYCNLYKITSQSTLCLMWSYFIYLYLKLIYQEHNACFSLYYISMFSELWILSQTLITHISFFRELWDLVQTLIQHTVVLNSYLIIAYLIST